MMKLRTLTVLLSLLPFVLNVSAFGQKVDRTAARPKPSFYSLDRPVIFGTNDDGFPDEILMSGRITGVNANESACGGIATAGTLRVALSDSPQKFKNGNIYVVVFCIEPGSEKKLLNRKIEMKATKLVAFPFEFGVFVDNHFDSKGEPFYLAEGGSFGDWAKFLK